MATRLERLWVLLDTGSTSVTRKAAAIQIGEIQKFHPHEFNNLLRKVCIYLASKSWETRVAAGQAVEAIAGNVKQWDPPFQPKPEPMVEEGGGAGDGETSPPVVDESDMLDFSTFDIKQVLLHGTPLLSSTGEEFQSYETDPELQKMSPQERLAFQRQQLKQRLGLSAQGKVFSTGMENLFDDNDLVTHAVTERGKQRRESDSKIKELDALQLSGMSVREKNKAKRKARQLARRVSIDTDSIGRGDMDVPPSKKPKTASVLVEQSGPASNKVLIDQVTDVEANFDESDEWPFAWFCEEMFQNLFNSAWEVRHGAATALREVIRLHGKSAGVSIFTPSSERAEVSQKWLMDAALRFLCVFSLDRFADFVSDQVVAPVRATCAQALGIVARLMSRELVLQMSRVLLLLASEDQWEVRHASLMGIQYLLAARTDLSSVLLPSLFPSVLRGLQDVDDDVRAVAANALLPVSGEIPSVLPDQISSLVCILWDSLLDLDDLSSSTNSIMELLGTLLSSPLPPPPSSSDTPPDSCATPLSPVDTSDLQKLVPRLWPFLSHTISSVRKSALRALLTLLKGSGGVGEGSKVEEPSWVNGAILKPLLCQVFQRFALEGDREIRILLHEVWASIISKCSPEDLSNATNPVILSWLCLLVAPSATPVNTSLIVPPSASIQVSSNLYLGGNLGVESHSAKEQAAFLARIAGTKALGLLASHMTLKATPTNSSDSSSPPLPEAVSTLQTHLLKYLAVNLALYRIVAVLVVYHWEGCPDHTLHKPLLSALSDTASLEDILPYIHNMQKDCQSLIVAFHRKGADIARDVTISGYTVEFANQLATKLYQQNFPNIVLSSAEQLEFATLRRNVLTSVGQLQDEHQRLSMRVSACVGGAIVSLGCLPEKLNPVIRPLMDCIKVEPDPVMQQLAASWLSQLVASCRARSPSPNTKIIKNICTSACCDPDHTPRVVPEVRKTTPTPTQKKGKRSQTPMTPEDECPSQEERGERWTWCSGIISLAKLRRQGKSSAKVTQGRGRPSAALKEALAASAALQEQRKELNCQRSGAETALTTLCKHFKESLFESLPHLWDQMTEPLAQLPSASIREEPSPEVISQAQCVVNSLQVLEVLAPSLAPPLHPRVLSLLPRLLEAIQSPFTAVRHMAARAVTSLAQVDLHRTMQFVISEVLPFLGAASSHVYRQGAIEVLACVLEGVGLGVLCYVVLLLMPVLGRMSDQQMEVRLMASRCFASLVTLMPLESGASVPKEMSADLAEQRARDRQFLEQLLDTSKLENYVVPVQIRADLRKYQQDGINWLAFLNKYKLHGILCDDMGLGKTLQSLCIIAGDHHYRTKEYKATGQMDMIPLPSLVVCPPTLTGHWYYEVKKFCDTNDLDPLQYAGSPVTRARLQTLVPEHNLIIASYDIVRNDIDFFRKIDWNYCILDEGHIIKNTKTKITKAVKQLSANHRLILSGTPIQNNVLELWSLFDFLMPGFLGTEKQFFERFGKPIIQSRDAKSSSKEQEAGVLAMESLHRQVLPFLLRRVKEDVLQDLPPKIIQDYHCDLSPLQALLYEDFSKSQAQKQVEDELTEEAEEGGEAPPVTHVFQALQYLRKVCNHPSLVVTPAHPMYPKVQSYLKQDHSDIRAIKHAAKLQALRQLLCDCGIGEEGGGGEDSGLPETMTTAVCQHRALVFCQYKSMLDIIERDLLKVHLPSVTYLRLDGSVPAANRFHTVHKFNSDPSVDVLLLTTHVGGLGLNLTGADTVIFFEHDWNPMKDLQAMDRAHRIGQKKVVNVYRLITKGTLEEKIMSLQKFKLSIANTVIGQDNSSLQSMNTSDLLDLFQVSEGQAGDRKDGAVGVAKEGGGGLKKVLDNLPELWDEQQYSEEYDLSGFMKSLTAIEDK